MSALPLLSEWPNAELDGIVALLAPERTGHGWLGNLLQK